MGWFCKVCPLKTIPAIQQVPLVRSEIPYIPKLHVLVNLYTLTGLVSGKMVAITIPSSPAHTSYMNRQDKSHNLISVLFSQVHGILMLKPFRKVKEARHVGHGKGCNDINVQLKLSYYDFSNFLNPKNSGSLRNNSNSALNSSFQDTMFDPRL